MVTCQVHASWPNHHEPEPPSGFLNGPRRRPAASPWVTEQAPTLTPRDVDTSTRVLQIKVVNQS